MTIANTTIQIKKSGTTGNKPTSLNYGELALNYYDGKLFYKDSSGNISYFYGANNGPSFATANANNNLILASTPNDTLSLNAANGISITACTTTKTITIGDSTTYSLASSASIYANGAFAQANAAFDAANTGSTPAYAFAQANAAFIQANAAFAAANTGSTPAFAFAQANAAFVQANSAYTRANNSVNANTGGTITGDINITGNLVVTGANVAFGNVGNVHIYGGNTGQLLSTDNQGNLSFIDLPTPNTITYTANSLIQTNGVYVSGNLWSTQVFGDYAVTNGVYVLTDGSGSAPAWYIDFDFISVVKFNRVVMNINYTQSSGHTIYVQLYNYITTAWDSIGTYTGLGSYYAFALEVIDETNYLSSGIVQLRLYHSNAGNVSHQTSIDYIALEQSYQGPQGPRGATGATGATGPGVATGGTVGQVLIKNSSTNYDTSWSDNLINAYSTANSAAIYANGSFVQANAAYSSQNVTGTYANSSYSQANSAALYANGAFAQANAAFAVANSALTPAYAFTQANAAFTTANSAALYANGAFIQSNAAFSTANSAGSYANSAFLAANSAGSYANSAFTKANSATITTKDEGTTLTTTTSSFNFVGSVVATNVGNDVTVTVGASRVVTITDGTSVTINGDITDIAVQTNTQAAGTLTINAITGTLYNGQKIMFRLKSTNIQTFSWNAVFSGSSDLALPTVSTGSTKYDYMGFIYNSDASKWQIIAKNFGF
jgi:hypothetical protein